MGAGGARVLQWCGVLAAITLAVGGISTVSAAIAVGPMQAPEAQTFQLNPLFQDHAVLQRGRPVTVWGQAPAGETVTVSLQPAAQANSAPQAAAAPRSAQTKVGTDGHWSLALAAVESGGGPYDLTAQSSSGANQSAHDGLVGDVFLCSGQSNMEMAVLRAGDSHGV